MPEGHDGQTKVGAIVYMHGYRGSARNVMKNRSMGKAVSDMGLALIAPKSAYEDWAIPGAPQAKEPVELEYFDALVKDVFRAFPNRHFTHDGNRIFGRWHDDLETLPVIVATYLRHLPQFPARSGSRHQQNARAGR